MVKIGRHVIPDLSSNPHQIVDFVRDEVMTKEEALCCVAAHMFGPTLRGIIKAEHFRRFWESKLSGSVYKADVLERAEKRGLGMVVELVKREEDQIYADTSNVAQAIRRKIPDLWDILEDSDVFWELPNNIYYLPIHQTSSRPGLQDKDLRERPDASVTDLTGQLSWSDPNINWSLCRG